MVSSLPQAAELNAILAQFLATCLRGCASTVPTFFGDLQACNEDEVFDTPTSEVTFEHAMLWHVWHNTAVSFLTVAV